MGQFFQSGQGQQSTNNSSSNSTNNSTTNPLLPGYLSGLPGSIANGYQTALATASMPVYGQAQQAQFLNANNRNTNSAVNSLQSNLASRGIVNSGANAGATANILQGGAANASNYEASIPGLNNSAFMSNVGGLLGGGGGFVNGAKVGSTTSSTGSTNSSSNGNINQTSNPSPFSDILGLIGGGLGAGSAINGAFQPGGGFK